MKQANEIIMRGDVLSISEDEPQVYSAEIKALPGELLNILVSIETDGEGHVIDSYCNCNDVNPCVHMAATLMGMCLMDSMECDNIQSAVGKLLKQV